MSVPMGGDRLPQLRELSLDELSDYDLDAGFERFVEQSTDLPVDDLPSPVPSPPPAPLSTWTRLALWGPSLLVLALGLGKGLEREGDRKPPEPLVTVAPPAPSAASLPSSPPRPAKLVHLAAPEARGEDASAAPPADSNTTPPTAQGMGSESRSAAASVRAPDKPSPAPSAQSETNALQAELELAARMRRALRERPAEALELAREGQSRFPRGVFVKERLEHEILALLRLGRETRARQLAEVFLERYPKGPQSERVRRALEHP